MYTDSFTQLFNRLYLSEEHKQLESSLHHYHLQGEQKRPENRMLLEGL